MEGGSSHLGRVIRDENGKVLKIVENKDATEEEKKITEINYALYVFDGDWLWGNIDKLKNENALEQPVSSLSAINRLWSFPIPPSSGVRKPASVVVSGRDFT